MTRHTSYRRFKRNPWSLISGTQGKQLLEKDEFLRNLGQAIRYARKQRKMTQEDLSEIAGVNPKYLGEIELGRANPTVLFLRRVSRALELEMTDLFWSSRYGAGEEASIYRETMSVLWKLDQAGLQKAHKVLKAMAE